MMQWFGALILFVTLSAVFGLRCHSCSGKSCTGPIDCPPNFDRCATAEVNGEVVKACMVKSICVSPIKCCEGDLCNSDQTSTKPPAPTSKPPAPTSTPPGPTSKAPVTTPKPPGPTPKPPGPTPKPPVPTSKPTGSSNIPTGSSVLLLLASSGIITLFL